LLAIIQEAVWLDRVLQMRYRRPDGTESERQVHPLGLVAKGSSWYLVGAAGEDIRTYRVSRIQEASSTDEPAVRPAGFDLADYWEQSSARFRERLPTYRVVLRISPDLLPQIRYGVGFTRIEEIGEPDADGWTRVTFNFGVEDEALSFILRRSGGIEVVEPRELSGLVVALARQIIERYAGVEPGT
jgi:predicted DNA-binding transcriptional regulator YafY